MAKNFGRTVKNNAVSSSYLRSYGGAMARTDDHPRVSRPDAVGPGAVSIPSDRLFGLGRRARSARGGGIAGRHCIGARGAQILVTLSYAMKGRGMGELAAFNGGDPASPSSGEMWA